MLGSHFYNEAIRKTVVSFGTLFNNIEIVKKNPDSGEILAVEKVPISYGPKQKFLYKLTEEQQLDSRRISIVLPRIYFEMTNISYDASRKVSPVQKFKNIVNNDGNEVRVQYVPVPYNIDFELGLLSKSQDDALQIIEQILPYFQPNFNVTINFIPEMDEKKDVAIILNSINYEDDWEDSFMQRRSIVWTLNFSAKTYIYGPFNQASIIRKAIVYESLGDFNQSRRNASFTYSPKALEDMNNDNVINQLDDALIMPDDDFGFNTDVDLF